MALAATPSYANPGPREGSRNYKGPKVRLFSFPRDVKRRAEWQRAVRRRDVDVGLLKDPKDLSVRVYFKYAPLVSDDVCIPCEIRDVRVLDNLLDDVERSIEKKAHQQEDKVRGRDGYLVDARPLSESNWMRYVNCAPSKNSENLVAFQRRGGICYLTKGKIAPGTELLVWYGNEFGAELGLVQGKKDGTQKKHQEEAPSLKGAAETFACGDCDSVFTSQEYLLGHQNNMFGKRGALTAHKRTHSGEKVYACELCPYEACTSSDVRRHTTKRHTKKYPHECGVCHKGFVLPRDLMSHMRNKHACDDQKH
ncbi:hypothetical protein HPB47_016905 [Ixodes persulcatus]|uniref:Uncharacterized protein n=1 Tax=Ixodes persulcatus TaxID=34615 RepID=A0AC60QQN9_IXOPE|nr:hypothetical protein HPB47_016905 [Ixodes persulcatus]